MEQSSVYNVYTSVYIVYTNVYMRIYAYILYIQSVYMRIYVYILGSLRTYEMLPETNPETKPVCDVTKNSRGEMSSRQTSTKFMSTLMG